MKETSETYALAAAGAIQGAYKYYRPQPATLAWIGLGVGVLAYDALSPPGQTMSEGVDRALEHSPIAKAATLLAIGAVALHLVNAVPKKYEKYDPIHMLTKFKK